MTDISSHFVLIDPSLISDALLLKDITYIPIGSREFACTGRISFEQTPTEDDRGVVWTMNFRAVTKNGSIRDYNAMRIYIGLIMTDGSIRIIGNASEAPLLSVAPYAGSSLVTATFQAANPISL